MALKHTGVTLPYILLRNKSFYCIIGHISFFVNILFGEKLNHNERKNKTKQSTYQPDIHVFTF